MSLGDRLKGIREKRGISQNELSRRTGVRQALISEIESGRKDDTTGKALRRLARELGVTTDYLIGMYEDEDSEQLTAALA